jgi:hypothetical protein
MDMICDYGCGNVAVVLFKNGKRCCRRRCHLCPAQVEKTRQTQHTADPITGLTPLQRRQQTLLETVDPESGLNLLQKRTKKMQVSQLTPDPLTGMTPRDKAELKLKQVDSATGKTLKQLAAQKALLSLSAIDPETGLTKMQLKTNKTHTALSLMSPDKKQEIINKRSNTLDKLDPVTGISKRKTMGRKISQNKNTVDPETGLTVAQRTAQKNKANPKWLENNTRGRASKESLKLFLPIMENIRDLNLKVYVGHEQNREWYLCDKLNKCPRFYDFCIPELKLIIEYHGEKYHPNPQLLDEDKWQSWRTPYTGKTADEVHEIDQLKHTLALEHGFEYHVVWSTSDIKSMIKLLSGIIRVKTKDQNQ